MILILKRKVTKEKVYILFTIIFVVVTKFLWLHLSFLKERWKKKSEKKLILQKQKLVFGKNYRYGCACAKNR